VLRSLSIAVWGNEWLSEGDLIEVFFLINVPGQRSGWQ